MSDNDAQLSFFDHVGLPVFPAIDDAFPNNESGELEFKSAAGGFPRSFWETYSAFANTEGGTILLGVKEQKGNLTIEGLDTITIGKYKKAFWDSVNDPKQVSMNLLREVDVQEVVVDGKTLLGFRIPMASRTQRPVHLTRNPFENTYKRNHEGDYRCTREEVRRMLADADLQTQPDSRVPEGFSMEDIDANSLKQYRQLFSIARPDHAWLALDDKELLTKLGGYRRDRASRAEGPTLAGLLMFGKESSITDPACIPNFFPDFREVLSADPQIRWTDRIYPDGTWEANLFQFYRRVWPRLSSSLPKPFQLKRGQRQDETPAHTALREAFVNALIHTDYSAPGNIVIEQHTDNYRFSNPGTLLVSIRQYYRGGVSECRNTGLQKMFLMIGSAEKAGSGVNKIMAGWEYAHWRSPYLEVFSQPDRLVLELPMFSILPEETLAELRTLFGDKVESLGKDELTILATCQIEGDITNARLQYMINLHRTDITKILQELCKDGYLLSDNKGRWTTYHLNTEAAKEASPEEGKMATSPDNVATSPDNVATSPENVATSPENVATSPENVATSPENVATSKGTKTGSERLEVLILQACDKDYKKTTEIALLVGRNSNYLKSRVIPRMLKEGILKRKYPDRPNHIDQAYKAVAHEDTV